MKFLGTMLGSDQPDVLGEFYTKLLGKPMYKQDGWYGFGDENGSLMIGGHSEVTGKNNTPARIMLSFVVDDVKKEFERITKLGATVVAEPYQPDPSSDGMWLATCADPDGNYLQLSLPWQG